MSIVDTYLNGLYQALPAEELQQLQLSHGASPTDLQALQAAYPQVPASLLELLGRIDGTHYREYPGGEICVLILGSDVFEYPYYLSSVAQILEEAGKYKDSIAEIYEAYLDEDPELLGAGIDPQVPMNRRLCFSHCMNNGGTSRLYLDFDPAPGGSVGQVVRFLHDPDSYVVIASSFDEYLQGLIEQNYAFIFEDE
ncbi:SMI1/KNR4 family protein [Pseudomonas sp. DTU_2021_1001937_2_SI_NGA_ILE_001]|uniref:SMI1/KNR4 family protein n=1 Tax=Pseudomonas sp. DTU_2021_1001937_2_SI_NGA_ILE_001 TaxID=3077589 RepID=UPI0028FC296D|nr:SMI1/KNR4 family protein [Pseudomonas sp. DTU_2021_1001937_2_SI_NGA_ILE_001]WNW12581.1 SMI1/KNR4 family protein [Pseudomonas sp. DTU_2021_1001937_2_SI_NGA_ILE_001]